MSFNLFSIFKGKKSDEPAAVTGAAPATDQSPVVTPAAPDVMAAPAPAEPTVNQFQTASNPADISSPVAAPSVPDYASPAPAPTEPVASPYQPTAPSSVPADTIPQPPVVPEDNTPSTPPTFGQY